MTTDEARDSVTSTADDVDGAVDLASPSSVRDSAVAVESDLPVADGLGDFVDTALQDAATMKDSAETDVVSVPDSGSNAVLFEVANESFYSGGYLLGQLGNQCRHVVFSHSFSLDRRPVSVAEYVEFVQSTGGDAPCGGEFTNAYCDTHGQVYDDYVIMTRCGETHSESCAPYPVVFVSWRKALEYCLASRPLKKSVRDRQR